MTVTDAFEWFIREHIREGGLSYDTEDNYQQACRSLERALGQMPIEALTFHDVHRWTQYLMQNGCGNSTIRVYKSKLKNVLKFTNKKSLTSFDLDEIVLPRVKRKLPKYLTAEEVVQVLRHTSTMRDEVIVSMLFSTGVRVNELVNMNRQDLHNDVILVRGKGEKEREVPLNSKTYTRLMAYLATRSDNMKAMFVTAKRCRIDKATVQRMVKRTAIEAGITRINVTPHVLRHSFATDLHSNGMDIRYVQYFMGHEHISTTQIYTHIIPQKAHAIFTQCQTSV